MAKKFCPKCGKITKELFENLCKGCFLEMISVSGLPKTIAITQCKSCKNYLVGKKLTADFDEALGKVLKDVLKTEYLDRIDYLTADREIELSMVFDALKLKKVQRIKLPFRIKAITCQLCSLKKYYFRCILQLRAPPDTLEKMFGEVKARMRSLEATDRFAFVSKVERKRYGIDVYTGSKGAGKSIAAYLRNKYKAKIKVSRKLTGVKRGRRVYIDTILISAG